MATKTTSEKKVPAKRATLKPGAKPAGLLIGYARVSTQDQNLELQTEALHKAGCKKIFEDRASGSRVERIGLAHARESLRAGDTLVVWKLDRLGRSVKQLVDLVGELQKEGVQFKSLTDSIDTGTPSGRFFFHVMASLAEMERELIVERTRAGLEVGVPSENGQRSTLRLKAEVVRLRPGCDLSVLWMEHREPESRVISWNEVRHHRVYQIEAVVAVGEEKYATFRTWLDHKE